MRFARLVPQKCGLFPLSALIAFGLLGASSTLAMEGDQPVNVTSLPPPEIWDARAGEVEKLDTPEGPVLRWKLESGQRSSLALKPSSSIFSALPRFDRLEFEFRVASGRIESFGLMAAGHVSGTRKFKVHDWSFAITTTPRNLLISRQIDLARPNWFPCDNPDGMKAMFDFGAVALEPNTVIELRDMRLLPTKIIVKPFFEIPISWPQKHVDADGSVEYRFDVLAVNAGGKPTTIKAEVASDHENFQISITPSEISAKSAETVKFAITAKLTPAAMAKMPELASETLKLRIFETTDPASAQVFEMPLVRPLSLTVKDQIAFAPETLATIRQRLKAEDDTLRKAFNLDAIIKEADSFCAIRLDQIPRGYQHPSNSWPVVPGSNPAVRYAIGSIMPEIINPVTGQKEIGTPIADGVWKEYLGYSGQITEKLGLAYALTGDEKYAQKAVELMSVYGRQYSQLPWCRYDYAWGGGPAALVSSRTAGSTSYGSNRFFLWHMKMLALIAGSPSLTPEIKQQIVEGFVRPYGTELIKFPGGISNMTDGTNHNLLILGLVFDDAGLVRHALRSDPGLTSRLTDLDSDGFSSEGRPTNYHYAAMEEYLPALAYLKNSGLSSEVPKDRLLEAVKMPYRRATLWGAVPNSGDCGRWLRVGPNRIADQLLELFPEEKWLLDLGVRSTTAAKIMAEDEKRTSNAEAYKQYLETTPRLFRDAGFAILRTGTTPETQVMATLDYGRSPMHAHLDRGAFTLSAFGRIYSQGPGTVYNAGSGGMTRNTDARLDSFCSSGSLGQNVILVDRENQSPAVGELLGWSDKAPLQYAAARIKGAHPGVTHTRVLMLQEGLVVVADRIESERPCTYDWVYHNLGVLKPGAGWMLAPESQPLGEKSNYQNIVDLQRLSGEGPVRLLWDLTEQKPPSGPVPNAGPAGLALWQLAPDGTQFFTGKTGMNNPNTLIVPDAAESLFSRVVAPTAEFITVFEPYHEGPRVTGVAKKGNQVEILRGDEVSLITIPCWEKGL